jgi:hypothetical protein
MKKTKISSGKTRTGETHKLPRLTEKAQSMKMMSAKKLALVRKKENDRLFPYDPVTKTMTPNRIY